MYTCVCIDSYDMPEPFSDKMVTARKEHHCCECGEVIKPGQTYEVAKGCWDGDWFTFKTCAPCRAIRNDFMRCGWIYGRLYEDLADIEGDSDWLTGRFEEDDDEE